MKRKNCKIGDLGGVSAKYLNLGFTLQEWPKWKFLVAAYASEIAYGQDEDDSIFLGIFHGIGFD